MFFLLATTYVTGGVLLSPRAAAWWHRQAAESGDVSAMCILAVLCLEEVTYYQHCLASALFLQIQC